jgi:predicted TIM-barrel fold metal-dependent hydrolase
MLGIGLIPLAATVSTGRVVSAESTETTLQASAPEPGVIQGGLQPRLRKALDTIRLVDAHEHLPTETQWLAAGPDVISLLGYALGDLVSAGMSKDALQPSMDPLEAWQKIAPYWPHVRNMGGGRLCRKTLAMFFGVDEMTPATIPRIRDELVELMQPGVYQRLLQQERNIEVCLNINPVDLDPTRAVASDVFAPLMYVSPLAAVQTREDIHKLEQQSGIGIYSLATYLQAVDAVLEKAVENGIVGIKWHKLAYLRDIYYPAPDPQAAERSLNRILQMPALGGYAADTAVGFDEMAPFQDLVQHHLVRRAIDLDLAVQIHTGILGGSYGAQITHTNPTHLTNLFLQYPQARFDLLHVSYPYMRELTAIVKLFPNVFINMAWFDVLAPRAVRQYLREWLSSVPTNKIFAFGADQLNVLLSCADAELAKDIVAETLAAEVTDGAMTEDETLETAKCLLRTNAWEYFKLEKLWAHRRAVAAGQQQGGSS